MNDYYKGENMSPDLDILASDLEFLEEGQYPVWQCEGCLTFFTEKEDLLPINHSYDREGQNDLDVKGECPYCNGFCREQHVAENDYRAIREVA